jgi:prepilin-type N-terminal cleavage/methylation domain-containing protein
MFSINLTDSLDRSPAGATLAPVGGSRFASARTRGRRAGLTLVECMIALAITAMLLTAVAAAFTAASSAINQNDQFFQCTQTARVALNRIVTQVRRGAVDDTSTSTSLHLITDTGTDVTYTYDATSQLLNMTIHANGADTTYVLARNVASCSFSLQTGTDFAGRSCVTEVAVSITVKVGSNSIGLSGSGAPRRNLAF